MSKLSTLNYLINSYNAGTNEVELQILNLPDSLKNKDQYDFEPSKKSIDAILSFASQYRVLESAKTGNIELNLN